jgi:hypothetical protein
MCSTTERVRNAAFLLLISIFAVLFVAIGMAGRVPRVSTPVLFALTITFAVVGAVVVALTLRVKEARAKKISFLLLGISAVAIPFCAFLHNVVYRLFIVWFGQGFWERHGGDEGIFFILAIIVFPALFLIGAFGCGVFLVKDCQSRWLRTGPRSRP